MEVQTSEPWWKGRLIRLGVHLHVGMQEREPDFWLEQPGEGLVSFTGKGQKTNKQKQFKE